jgi:transcription elongation factor GreA
LVSIGKTVVLQLGDLPEQEFTLVGSLEADPIKKRISNESPIGKGIIGSKKGDTLVVKTETGRDVVVTIINVK